jgi:hypothetical protein
MTFATITRIKTLRNYGDAQRAYHLTKPLRGQKGSDVRPLGQRRDGHQYYIEKHEGEKGNEFWCFLYNSPVVKFLPEDKIEVCTFGWGTGMTMAFISQVLDIHAYRTRGNCVFVINDTKYVTKNEDKLLLGSNPDGKYYVIHEAKHTHYVVNRTGANNVRKRTSEFRKYLKGFLSLRTETVVTKANVYSREEEITRATVSVGELLNFFPTKERKDWQGNVYHSIGLGSYNCLTAKSGAYTRFIAANEELNALIADGQGDDVRTENFYKAALILCAVGKGELVVGGHGVTTDNTFYVVPTSVTKVLDEAQFKFYSSEVFSLVPVPQGKVPRTEYDTWVNAGQV